MIAQRKERTRAGAGVTPAEDKFFCRTVFVFKDEKEAKEKIEKLKDEEYQRTEIKEYKGIKIFVLHFLGENPRLGKYEYENIVILVPEEYNFTDCYINEEERKIEIFNKNNKIIIKILVWDIIDGVTRIKYF